MDLLLRRLDSQRLTGEKFSTSKDAVSFFGVVQAQDFAAAKWSLSLRVADATNAIIEEAYNKGDILRTHVLRPTWHFVSPEDIRPFLALSAPQIKKITAYYNKHLGLTEEVLQKTNRIITKALTGKHFLTRQEIKACLEKERIPTDVQRLGHIVMSAEIEGLITSGPMRGKQFTYALLDERVPQSNDMQRDEVLARLAEKYFTSHGPAQVKDFAWWSGLSIKQATEGVSFVASKFEKISINNKTYWFAPKAMSLQKNRQKVFLLSVYDEYFISYTDRTEIYDNQHKDKLPIGNALLTSLIIRNGKVAGTWKRTISNQNIDVTLYPFSPLQSTESEELEKIVNAYGTFFGLPVQWKVHA
ncbi:MAG: AlkZ family DNA glycosylase [Patescibacteria group bacterium]|nr:AlkZ family DNA glycosylase [Patescibacteria group bacterium]MDE2588966.1 AlkZ family DNA glycosylase [Patescibacteria group bacterium]